MLERVCRLWSSPAMEDSAAAQAHQALFDTLEAAVASRVTPGCVALVWRDDAVVYHEAHGELGSYVRPRDGTCAPGVGVRVQRETIYDLASLTKVLVTGALIGQELAAGRMRLDQPLPDPFCRACPAATLQDLLEHCAGLVAHREFFAELTPPLPSAASRAALIEAVWRTPAADLPRRVAVYSDLGFMLLGAWIESALGERLDRLFERRIAQPLGLPLQAIDGLGFFPVTLSQAASAGAVDLSGIETVDATQHLLDLRVAPTEVYDPGLYPHDAMPGWAMIRMVHMNRSRGFSTDGLACAHGQVHDDNAFAMQGVAGHAGLFGNAQSVLELALAWLRGRIPGLKREWVQRFWQRSEVTDSSRCLAWDGVDPNGEGSTGHAMSEMAVGHLGYTGTSLWIDPIGCGRGPWIAILLSNRVHPRRGDPESIRQLRRSFHRLASQL